jgi:hypothetical protein
MRIALFWPTINTNKLLYKSTIFLDAIKKLFEIKFADELSLMKPPTKNGIDGWFLGILERLFQNCNQLCLLIISCLQKFYFFKQLTKWHFELFLIFKLRLKESKNIPPINTEINKDRFLYCPWRASQMNIKQTQKLAWWCGKNNRILV